MAKTKMTANEARLMATRQVISGRAWDTGRWIDGRKVIVSGPAGNILADVAIVMPAVENRKTPDGWVGAEGVELSWEEVAVRLMGNGIFGTLLDQRRPYRGPYVEPSEAP